jgi:hypothetical protein
LSALVVLALLLLAVFCGLRLAHCKCLLAGLDLIFVLRRVGGFFVKIELVQRLCGRLARLDDGWTFPGQEYWWRLEVAAQGNNVARFKEIVGLAGSFTVPVCQLVALCDQKKAHASAHSWRLNSACCARRCALLTLDDGFLGSSGTGTDVVVCKWSDGSLVEGRTLRLLPWTTRRPRHLVGCS